jgi:Methylase involved in ubiquinone/menaquinone biosynthesis
MFSSDNSTPHTAETYDAQVRKTLPYYDSFHSETLNLIKATKVAPEAWLDTGCGTGTLAQKAIAQYPETTFVLADPSVQMLQAAKQKLSGYGNVEFIEAPTENLTELTTRFDVVTAIQSHHYSTVQGREQATQVCYNLLNQKGIYITFENTRPFTQQGTVIGLENWKNWQIKSGKTQEQAEAHIKRFGAEYHPITVEEHLALLRRTGFSVVELLWYSYLQAGFYCIK